MVACHGLRDAVNGDWGDGAINPMNQYGEDQANEASHVRPVSTWYRIAGTAKVGCGRDSKSVSTDGSRLQPPTAHVVQESHCANTLSSARSNRRVRKAW